MTTSGQPVISRETRRLLITIVLAVAALWVLARIRFQERPVTSTPVPNVLAQLRPASSYADLARLIADIRPVITAAVSASPGGGPALRIREDAAVTLMPGRADTLLMSDRATGLAIVQHPHGDMPGLMPWAPRLLDYPRYLVAADADRGARRAAAGVHRRAVSCDEPALVRRIVGASAGDGDDARDVRVHDRRRICRPQREPRRPGGDRSRRASVQRGRAVAASRAGKPATSASPIQPLSPAIASAAGAATGVVISTIDPAGAAAGRLVPTEVIEAIDGQDMRTPDHWTRACGARERRRHC